MHHFSWMMRIPRWGNLLILKNSITLSTTRFQFASFHSTPIAFDKRKKDWSFTLKKPRKPTKKRADAKKALKDLLFKSGASNHYFHDKDPMLNYDGKYGQSSNKVNKKPNPSSSSNSSGRFAGKSKVKRRHRRETFSEDFDQMENIFEAELGNRWCTWSSWKEQINERPSYGFEWREQPNFTNGRTKNWDCESHLKSEDESFRVGSCMDRTTLGLPKTGPLKIEDVKKAYRLSALKWHPDKNQGPSQDLAVEKFIECVKSYKSLLNIYK